MSNARSSESPSWPRAGLTAMVLGMSWTWCIGMFLPVLLLRDLGLGAFFVFAIPNIIGAAAMGWVLRSAEQSRQMVDRHSRACIWFSLVTIVFHAFFAGWIIWRLIGPFTAYALPVGLSLMLFLVVLPRFGPELGAVVALLVSVSLAGWGIARHDLPNIAQKMSQLPATDVYWLAPVCLLGFLLCPYLDLTFHAARQSAGARAKAAFAVGFGFFFAAMLAFTLLYSGWLVTPLTALHRPIAWILAIHFTVQSCYTMALHEWQLMQRTKLNMRVFVLALIFAVVLGTCGNSFHHAGLSSGEIAYRGFMAFYGLVFPAYVLLKIATRRPIATKWFWATIILAAPFYELGFIERKTIWLLPGVLIVLLVRLVARSLTPIHPAIRRCD